MIVEQILNLYQVSPEEVASLKTPEGEFDAAKVAQILKAKNADLLKEDPEFLMPIAEEARRKAEEKVIVATKAAKKAFKQLAAIELSNAEIDALSLEDLYRQGIEKLKTSTGADREELHAEIQKLNAALEAERESKVSEIERVKSEFQQQQERAIVGAELAKALAATEWIVPASDVLDTLEVKLSKAGVTLRPVNGVLTPFKGEVVMKKADGIQRADLAYIFDTYLGSFKKQSNGSGSNGKGNPTRSDYTEEQKKKFSPEYLKWKEQQMAK